jgi:cell filamentation protein
VSDPYLYADVSVLRNKLDIKDGQTLDLIEAEQSRANMMILYERGFHDFSPAGLCFIHRFLFGDIYSWAGEYRKINIEKAERLLGGRSVWYSNDEMIDRDLQAAFEAIQAVSWESFSREEFIAELVKRFPPVWQVHPFREGNTRTIVMLLTFFVEVHGYFFDKDLLAACAGYVRDSLVMASIDQFSEPEHLERILLDAVCTEEISSENVVESEFPAHEKYAKYQREPYHPSPHTLKPDN